MPHPLKRLLRLRSLVEETSRMELEGRAALVTRIDQARKRELRTVREGRALAIESICEDDGAGDQTGGRSAGWSAAETAVWRERQLAPLAEAAERRVMESREEFFERRKERRQVESVLGAAEERMGIEQERRTQRELDDWFGMKQARSHRGQGKAEES